MIEKLGLPFPLLSDPDRSGAIAPYAVADEKDERNIARPATVFIGPDGTELHRVVSRDFADRAFADEIVATARSMGLPPTTQEPPQLGPAEPGPGSMKLEQMVPYYRGARFAAVAMGRRFPEAREEADRYVAQMDGYMAAAKARYKEYLAS